VKRLVINADDFGLTSGVNQAIVELHRRGTLTSTTLMANAQATEEAIDHAIGNPSLGVGCHIVLVDGAPMLPPEELPTLVDSSTGRFRPTLGQFVQDLFLGRIRPSEIAAEAEAQIAHLRNRGLRLTHIDTHKHTHMFPRVLEPLLKAAQRQHITAIRNPFEPAFSVAATRGAPTLRRAQVQVLNRFKPSFLRRVAAAGLSTTDGAIGILATGTLDATTLASLLQHLPDGTWELVTHPGYNDDALAHAGTRLLASRDAERDALNQTAIPADVQLIHFGRLTNATGGSS
jgi:chitin disaccharide deacetylase